MHLEQHDLAQRGQLHAGLGGAHSSQLLDRDHRVRVQLDRLGHHAERALAELAALVLAQLPVARGRPAQREARCEWVGGMRARAQRGAAISRRRRTWHVDARAVATSAAVESARARSRGCFCFRPPDRFAPRAKLFQTQASFASLVWAFTLCLPRRRASFLLVQAARTHNIACQACR